MLTVCLKKKEKENTVISCHFQFLFMEPAEADLLLNSMNTSNSQLSPRRRIEVSQTVTPSGTRVTTTTTTTQKPQYGRQEPGYNSRILVFKHDLDWAVVIFIIMYRRWSVFCSAEKFKSIGSYTCLVRGKGDWRRHLMSTNVCRLNLCYNL